jgi:co-chaperonin GroES (HSP10)
MMKVQFDGEHLKASQLPEACGYQIILAPIHIAEQTTGGIILTDTDQKQAQTVRFVARVLVVGPLAYKGDKFKEHPNANPKPWCRVGDVVTTSQYAGSQIPCKTEDGESYVLRVVNDDEIKTRIPDISILNV